MPTLAELVREHAALTPAEEDWVRLVVSDWQLVSDLSFADLVLWVRIDAESWHAVTHVRPTTGQTVHVKDRWGAGVGAAGQDAPGELCDPTGVARPRHWSGPRTSRCGRSPSRGSQRPRAGRHHRHTNLAMMRTPSRLELTYLATADSLLRMISTGDFPARQRTDRAPSRAPRVGDGVIRLDVDGQISYASPNAVSALHRIGHLGRSSGLAGPGRHLRAARHSPVDEGMLLVLTGRQPWRTEVSNAGAVISMRAIPLTGGGPAGGAILLVRDISELRRREQELMTRDATIREIHHRVKNNLQSVAALLRLQARRMPDAKRRAALAEAVRQSAPSPWSTGLSVAGWTRRWSSTRWLIAVERSSR
ncbi:MAG: sensor histidine kinase [Actinomycetales bacterium]|nr:sensor histidine kinase [Actinomycetales bacterium]